MSLREVMKTLRNILITFVGLIVIALTVYDTHTDLIINCEKVHTECKLIAAPVNGGK